MNKMTILTKKEKGNKQPKTNKNKLWTRRI